MALHRLGRINPHKQRCLPRAALGQARPIQRRIDGTEPCSWVLADLIEQQRPTNQLTKVWLRRQPKGIVVCGVSQADAIDKHKNNTHGTLSFILAFTLV